MSFKRMMARRRGNLAAAVDDLVADIETSAVAYRAEHPDPNSDVAEIDQFKRTVDRVHS